MPSSLRDDGAPLPCPLCRDGQGQPFHRDSRREYWRCRVCALIFVSPQDLPSPEEEKAEYDLHRNGPRDEGYRRFLGRLVQPMNERLSPGSRGLDFGSGPGPTLSVMFEEAGHGVALFDPFYAPDEIPLAVTYDFVTATEVFEHLHHPRRGLDRLWACLRPGGWLGVMTKLALNADAFAGWHYKEDRTHVVFFSRTTFEWLARHWSAELTFVGQDVMLLRRIGGAPR